jgi:hypothetical protein
MAGVVMTASPIQLVDRMRIRDMGSDDQVFIRQFLKEPGNGTVAQHQKIENG